MYYENKLAIDINILEADFQKKLEDPTTFLS